MKIREFADAVMKQQNEKSRMSSRNIKLIEKISGNFHREARIKPVKPKINDDALVIETGHQPLFLPFSGIWRKAYLADHLRRLADGRRDSVISVFGFMDHDTSSSKLLYQNKVPKMNKAGHRNIGLKRPENSDIWKRFNAMEKPEPDVWEKVIDELLEIYSDNKNVYPIAEELWKSYELSENLADVNAIFFARICHAMGIETMFFRCSDVQNEMIFLEVWETICRNLDRFVESHNKAIEMLYFEDLERMKSNDLPFWYHCTCGGKAQLSNAGTYVGKCRCCGEMYEFECVEDILKEFKHLSPKAIMRNIIFYEGLRTDIFVSGSGGSLRYGRISNIVSREFDFSIPLTLYWVGNDIYTGHAHVQALKSLKNEFKIEESQFFEREEILEKIREKRMTLYENVKNSMDNEKKAKKFLNQYKQTHNVVKAVSNIFLINPSLVDVVANCGIDSIKKVWEKSLEDSEITAMNDGEFYGITRDIIYETEEELRLYQILQNLENESLGIDPLGIL